MVERYVVVLVPEETLKQYRADLDNNEPLIKEVVDSECGSITQTLGDMGYLYPGDAVKVSFVGDPSAKEDVYVRKAYLYEAVRDETGRLIPGEMIDEIEIDTPTDRYN